MVDPPALTPESVLSRLEWRIIRRLDGRLQENYRTLFRGAGVDVVDLREDQPGDDLRHIYWNVTARTDTPHVRRYLEDRDVTAWLPVVCTPVPQAARGPVKRQTSTPASRPCWTMSMISSSVSRVIPLPWLTRCTRTPRSAPVARTARIASGPSTLGISTR
jgi:hypothetical protein